jgi:hypothetical protein
MTPFEHVIAVEGVETPDRRLCLPGSLTWETPMPVMGKSVEGEWSVPIIGTIESVRRSGTLIWATGHWFEEEPPRGKDYGFCVTLDSGEYTDDTGLGDPLTLKHGRIRAVYLGNTVWPECDR